MKTSARGVELIKKHELLRLKAYLCPAGVPTIGWGSTRGVVIGMTITEEQAKERLRTDLEVAESAVNKCGATMNQNEFDALVSFTFNVGVKNFLGSTLLKKLRQDAPAPKGRPWERRADVAKEFGRWVYARNPAGVMVQLPGLVKRRADERALFTEPVP